MKRKFTMEDVTEDVIDDVTPEEETEMVAEEAEVEAEAEDIMEDVDSVDEATEAADEVEAIEETIEETLEDDGEGLDPVAAEAIRNHLESIGRRVGYDTRALTALYSEESFGTESARRANTQLTFESVSQFLKDLWRKIWSFLRATWDKVQGLMSKILPTLGNLRKALEQLRRRVDETKGSVPAENKEFELPGSLAGPIRGLANGEPKTITSHFGDLAKGYDEGKKLIEGQRDTLKTLSTAMKDAASGDKDEFAVEVTEGDKPAQLASWGAGSISYGLRTVKIGGVSGAGSVDVISGFATENEDFGAGAGGAVKTTVADKTALKAVCTSAIQVLERAEAMSKASGDYNKALKQYGNQIDAALTKDQRSAAEGEGKKSTKHLDTLVRNFRDSASGAARLSTKMVSNAKSSGGWAVRYVNLNLKKYVS